LCPVSEKDFDLPPYVKLIDRIQAMVENHFPGASKDLAEDLLDLYRDQEDLKQQEYRPPIEIGSGGNPLRNKIINIVCDEVEVSKAFKVPYNLVAYVAQRTLVKLSAELKLSKDMNEGIEKLKEILDFYEIEWRE